jgi:hypothetical protein
MSERRRLRLRAAIGLGWLIAIAAWYYLGPLWTFFTR